MKLDKRKIKKILNNPSETAAAVKLVYVSDQDPGITRVRENEAFCYYYGRKKIHDEENLLRISSLVIPPAWQEVWICKQANGHLQATGLDVKKRKQYRYHPQWNAIRNETKFFHILDFGKA